MYHPMFIVLVQQNFNTSREFTMKITTYITIMTICTCILFPPVALIVVLALICAMTL
jgi:hypothetical protein